MKKLLAFLFALFISYPALAAELQQYQPGPRLIDGSQLNKMVDVVNGLTANGTATAMKAGQTALDGSNPTSVSTGLTSIISCTTTMNRSTAPGTSTSVVTYTVSGGTLSLYGWRPTAVADTTLVASTGTETVGWICVGN